VRGWPDKFTINPHSGRPMARDEWGAMSLTVWGFRGFGAFLLCFCAWSVLSGEGQGTQTLFAGALFFFTYSEVYAAALRRRRAEFREADREYVKALQEAVDP
jgi:hypothetical protein